jgi:two-component system, OmpR family, sensor histidine kinase QseC
MNTAISLQDRLLKSSILSSIIAGLLALIVFLALSIYHTMQIHDEIMDEVADMLVTSDLSRHTGEHIDEITEEFAIEYALKTNDLVLVTSPHFKLDHVQSTKGYALRWESGQLWRSYVLNENRMQAQVYQPLWLRVQDLIAPLLWFIGTLALLWLIQWLLVRIAIQRQFRSLELLSQHIAQKNAQDLTPILSPQTEFLELQPILNQLNQLLGRLDQSLHAEQRFTADASHELRSPLSAIQMRLQVLKRKYQDQAQLRQDLQPIQNDVARSTQVLENLLLLARLDPSQAQHLPKTRCDLQQICLEVLEALLPFIEEKQIDLDVQLSEFYLEANRELLFTCIRNLLDNAVRYSPVAGAIKIHIDVEQKSICICNTGEQISAEVMAHLGERFYRALGNQSTGSGLGISICQKIVALHAARLTFEAQAQGGLKVRIDFA